jgi:hypothetical protein
LAESLWLTSPKKLSSSPSIISSVGIGLSLLISIPPLRRGRPRERSLFHLVTSRDDLTSLARVYF